GSTLHASQPGARLGVTNAGATGAPTGRNATSTGRPALATPNVSASPETPVNVSSQVLPRNVTESPSRLISPSNGAVNATSSAHHIVIPVGTTAGSSWLSAGARVGRG